MKRTLIIILCIIVIVLGIIEIGITINQNKKKVDTSSVAESEQQSENEEIAEGFAFKDGNITIELGKEFSKETLGLGEEKSYSEIASCAFEGLDKTYTYENYEITTFPDGDKDRVYTIYFLNETVSTTEGVKISDDKEKMLSTYGENYETQGNQYTYNKGKTNLEFIVENDVITSIQYSYVTE